MNILNSLHTHTCGHIYYMEYSYSIYSSQPASQKCKLLPLGKWKTSLKQEDLPPSCNDKVVSDHLYMVGVELRSTWTQIRKANGDIIQKRHYQPMEIRKIYASNFKTMFH